MLGANVVPALSNDLWSWVPGFTTDWNQIPTWTLAFGALFLLALGVFRGVVGLPVQQAALLASCSMSSAHAAVCCTYGYAQIKAWQGWKLDMGNTPDQTSMLQFSTSYMIADSLFYVLVFTPTDVMFIVHHTISVIYVVGVLSSGAGAISAIFMYFLGEITSPLLNAVTFAETLGVRSRTARTAHRYLSPLFTGAFIVMRTLLGIPLVGWFLYSLALRSPRIPLHWRIPLVACVSAGMLGSQAWTVKLVAGMAKQWRLSTAVHRRRKTA